jgi:sec-independent protein translocase protein TatB
VLELPPFLPGSMMKPMSFSETIFLFFLALIIFGPKKLPEIARQVGKYLNEFRRASNEFKAQIEQEIQNLEVEERKRTILPPSPQPEGTASRTPETTPAQDPTPSESSSSPTHSESITGESKPAQTSATLAAPGENSGSASPVAEPATEALPVADAVPSSTSQESHA